MNKVTSYIQKFKHALNPTHYDAFYVDNNDEEEICSVEEVEDILSSDLLHDHIVTTEGRTNL